ncbi:MAG TPA: hypothetical protein VFY29_21310 [Terriglobia bacterium]|nr:hypothetical protein [Terriglobia bacterium]
MGRLLVSILLPPLLVFGLYHLATWVNVFQINRVAFWKRVAAASAAAHLILLTGFFLYLYGDYRAGAGNGASDFGAFLFTRSEFRYVLAIFDTTALVSLLAFFATLDRLGLAAPGLAFSTIAITYIAGTIQWYLIGGAAGAVLERFWAGLKTDDDDEWFP